MVEGDYDTETPTPTQLESLAQMVAWASTTFDVSVDTMSGHRDHAATTCPGDSLYAKLLDGTIADRAQTIIDDGGVTLTIGSAQHRFYSSMGFTDTQDLGADLHTFVQIKGTE